MKFQLGRILATPAAMDALAASNQKADTFLAKHAAGDWGGLSAGDWKANDQAVIDGERILSAYTTSRGTRLWIITEADRSVTTILLPDEY